MKVLFALNNDKVSDTIAKTYQNQYREILSYKNVYYFNAIYKELQKDQTYTRIVISEDLEPFANNDYELIDKFLLEKLENISNTIKEEKNTDIEVILICSDRRNKTEDFLNKIYDMGIYNAIIGDERKIDLICKLLYSPRNKQEAQAYYEIEPDFAYQDESENNVSEAEIQNILEHYRRIGKNEDKYLDSFNNIITQYNDEQLRIIIKCLPMNVRAVLEARSEKYQQLITFKAEKKNRDASYMPPNSENRKKAINITMLKNQSTKAQIRKPIIIPKNIELENAATADIENKNSVLQYSRPVIPDTQIPEIIKPEIKTPENLKIPESEPYTNANQEDVEQKRGRGRPKKLENISKEENDNRIKKGRGRPKKNQENIPATTENNIQASNAAPMEKNIDLLLEGINNEESNTKNVDVQNEIDLFNSDENKQNIGNQNDEALDLFSMGIGNNDDTDDKKTVNSFNMDIENTQEFSNNATEKLNDIHQDLQTEHKENSVDYSNYSNLKIKDSKVVAFVGTTKNGTSFVVNNTAEMLSTMGISTAILDMTKSKNAYYIYTKNEENLRNIAANCIDNLQKGVISGINVNNNLTVFTEMPNGHNDYNNMEQILLTLAKQFSVILVDCDFETPNMIFAAAQEIYLVQSMDVLTIQPLTAFLRNLKSKNILEPEKIKVIVNKYEKIKTLNIKTLIGGMAFYNDPSMSFMTDLFNKDTVEYFVLPFEIQNYIKYLDDLVNCSVSLKGYTKQLIEKLQDLAGHVYPLINKNISQAHFSNETNNILNKMKQNY